MLTVLDVCKFTAQQLRRSSHVYKHLDLLLLAFPDAENKQHGPLGVLVPVSQNGWSTAGRQESVTHLQLGKKKSKYLLKNNRARIAFSLSRYTGP